MIIRREDIPRRVSELVGRPARWVRPETQIGDYEGRERTIEIFNAEPHRQRALLRELRGARGDLERAAGGPLIVIFHTPGETLRLHPDVLAACSPGPDRYVDLATWMGEWMERDHSGELAVDPDDVEEFNVRAA